MIVDIYIGITVFFILTVLVIKYLNGDFDYKEELEKEERVIVEGRHVGYLNTIRRTYKNGRIKIRYEKFII